jgi:thiamine pyrophosphate-dependent acetolactate synthase large subunit-like protein
MTIDEQTGGHFVCAALRAAGCDVVFSVSGNQILPIFDAAHDAGIRIVHMRHESAAAYAAAAYAELTGALGVALTSAGPGFLAGLQGVAAARMMELPLLYLSGDSAVTQRGMGAFQEFDQKTVAETICKASLIVDSAATIPGLFATACQVAQNGIPGPVHIGLPGDVLATAEVPKPAPVLEGEPPLDDSQRAAVREIAQALQAAQRPLILARPSAARGAAGELLHAVAAKLGIEAVVIEAPRGLADLKYASVSASFAESDCALVLAPPDFALGFLSREQLARDGKILLVDADGDPLSKRDIDLHLRADSSAVLSLLNSVLTESTNVDPNWSQHWPLPAPPDATEAPPAGVHPLAVSAALRATIGPDDVIVLDGGEFCQWIRLGLRDIPNPVLWNGKIGAIGGAIPMSVGAALAAHGRRVIAVMGDGASGYHLSEFETMDRYSLPIITIIGNDARWAAEWHLQIARYGPERTFETELTNARYDRVASSFNLVGEHITSAESLSDALHEVYGRGGATCLNVEVAALPSPAAMS